MCVCLCVREKKCVCEKKRGKEKAHDTFLLTPTPHAVQRESLPEDNLYSVSVRADGLLVLQWLASPLRK